MDEYRLSRRALRDLEGIRRKLQLDASIEVADKVLAALFDAFEELVRLPSIGHRRADLPASNIQFHNVYSYVIAFHREPRVIITRVIHGARDLPRRL